MSTGDELVPTHTAVKELGLSLRQFYKLIDTGALRAVSAPGPDPRKHLLYIPRSELDRYRGQSNA